MLILAALKTVRLSICFKESHVNVLMSFISTLSKLECYSLNKKGRRGVESWNWNLAERHLNWASWSMFYILQSLYSSKLWSSQLWTQFKQLRIKAWKSHTGIARSRVHNCDDHSLLDFKSAVQYMKHFIYHFRACTVKQQNQHH